ncbi:hypothetical protein CEB3_c05340 [Peptococcaceae bacterium CEB3]|nr:hypothetical protein CEB3_c05340 [Peptococcaceae bacterium CEB3]
MKMSRACGRIDSRGKSWGMSRVKKLGILLAIAVLVVSMMPGVAAATTYNNDVPSGLTLIAWTVNPNDGGKSTMINFVYSGGFSAPTGIKASFEPSWHTIDDVRPIILAEQEGYGNYLGGTNGSFGTNIKFAPNVLAAMKVQNFNPAQVGGANIPPSSTSLSSSQTAWLKRVGYSIPAASQPTSKPVTASKPATTSTPTAQTPSQPKPVKQQTTSTQSSTTAQAPAQSNSSKQSTSVTTNPGKTIKTPSGSMTPEMVAADQKAVAKNPPNLNPTNIPIKIPAKPVKKAGGLLSNRWVWIGIGVVIVALAAAVGRIAYLRRRAV